MQEKRFSPLDNCNAKPHVELYMQRNSKQKKTANKPSKDKRNMRSFELDPDLVPMIDAAVKGGMTFKELVNEALRTSAPAAIKKIVAQMRENANSIEKNIPGGKH